MTKKTPTGIPGLQKIEGGYALRVVAKHGSLIIEKTKTLRGVDRRTALIRLEQLRDRAMHEAESKARGETTTETLTAYARRWCEELGQRQVRGKLTVQTTKSYVANLTNFVLPYFGHFQADEVKAKDAVAWLRWLERQKTQAKRKGRDGVTFYVEPRPYAKGCLRGAWRTARVFFRWVVVEADLAKNPFDHVRFDVDAPGPRPKPTLTQKEVAALLVAAREETLKVQAMLVVGFCGATRFSELSALEWKDVNLEEGYIRIERSQVRGVVGPPKTERSRRIIALPPEAVDMLRRLLAWQKETGDLGYQFKDLLFASRETTYLTPKALTPPLRRCAKRAGIDKALSSHCLRRTSNNLIRQAAGELVAQAVTGHVTLEMTRHYSDVDTEERVMALQAAFGDALGAGLSEPQATGSPKNQWENSQLSAPKSVPKPTAPKPGTQGGGEAKRRGELRPAPLKKRERRRTFGAFPQPAPKLKKPREVRGVFKLWRAQSEDFRILLAWVKKLC
jgi:integrase